jgi:hypothetical protein
MDAQVKTVGLRIRIEPELRKAFLEACRRSDQKAAQVVRGFMRRYVDEQESLAQMDMFASDDARLAGSPDRAVGQVSVLDSPS